MGFFFIFIFCILATFFLFSYGYILNKFIFKFKFKNYSEVIILGSIGLTFVALVINFLSSLNPLINTIFFVLSFFLFFFIKELNIFLLLKTVFLISLFGFITFILDSSNRPDAGLYHLPYISLLNEEKIVFGAVNLHFRFGHVSSLQYLSSLFNNFLFKDNGVLIPLTIIYSASLLFFYDEFKKNSNNKSAKLFSFFSIIFILTSMNRYSEFGNDDPAVFFYLITIYYFLTNFILKSQDTTEIFNKVLLFSASVFLIKQFYALIVFFPLYLLIISYKKIKIINNTVIFSFLFVGFWLFKNLLVTACIIYPINFTCIDSLSWSASETNYSAKIVTTSSEAWAKAYPDRIDTTRNEIQHLSDNEWLNGWLDNHLPIVIHNLMPLMIIAFIIILLSFKSLRKNIKTTKIFNIIFISNLFFSLYWFLKFPTYRYGAAYLGLMIIILILIIAEKINLKKKFNKIMTLSLIILSVIILSKNFKRILKNYNENYIDYPWPKKNSFTKSNLKNINTPVYQDGKIIYYHAYPYVLCMYSKAPCTHFRNKILRKNILKRYKLFAPK